MRTDSYESEGIFASHRLLGADDGSRPAKTHFPLYGPQKTFVRHSPPKHKHVLSLLSGLLGEPVGTMKKPVAMVVFRLLCLLPPSLMSIQS